MPVAVRVACSIAGELIKRSRGCRLLRQQALWTRVPFLLTERSVRHPFQRLIAMHTAANCRLPVIEVLYLWSLDELDCNWHGTSLSRTPVCAEGNEWFQQSAQSAKGKKKGRTTALVFAWFVRSQLVDIGERSESPQKVETTSACLRGSTCVCDSRHIFLFRGLPILLSRSAKIQNAILAFPAFARQNRSRSENSLRHGEPPPYLSSRPMR